MNHKTFLILLSALSINPSLMHSAETAVVTDKNLINKKEQLNGAPKYTFKTTIYDSGVVREIPTTCNDVLASLRSFSTLIGTYGDIYSLLLPYAQVLQIKLEGRNRPNHTIIKHYEHPTYPAESIFPVGDSIDEIPGTFEISKLIASSDFCAVSKIEAASIIHGLKKGSIVTNSNHSPQIRFSV